MSLDDDASVSESDAKRVLDRAAQLEAQGRSAGLSLAELRAAASEAGFSPSVVDRAIAETLRQSGTHEESLVVRKGFVISRYTISVTLDATLSESEIRRIASLNTPYWVSDPDVRIDDDRAWWKDRRRFRFELVRGSASTTLNVSSPLVFLVTAHFETQVTRAIRRLEAIASFVAAASAARRQ